MKTFKLSQFQLGQILATPGALEALADSGEPPNELICRHAAGDWGDVCDEDAALNDQAVEDGSRLLSAYETSKGVTLWIITDAADDTGNRQATTILTPDEY